jgi:hypothetical protein
LKNLLADQCKWLSIKRKKALQASIIGSKEAESFQIVYQLVEILK